MPYYIFSLILTNNSDLEIESTLNVLENLIDARGLKEEDLDTIGEILSNLEGALEVTKLINEGSTQKDALNSFMKRVISVGK